MTSIRYQASTPVLPFDAIDRADLSAAGGKAANLGELTRAGFPVPPGFCVTTDAYAAVAGSSALSSTLGAISDARPDDTARLAELASEARAALLASPVPDHLAEAITGAYLELGGGEPVPVAVRSSATAEDLPHASFAGQQDTYLNVLGENAVLDAVRRCWASLWTDRAVSYRAGAGIPPGTVRLAVVVQRMVEAEVAGVMFTANPVTGKRRQAVIDASPGLGEAVVSGAVNPDHFVVDTPTGEILERALGDKRVAIRAARGGGVERVETGVRENEASLSDAQIRALAELGTRVEGHYGAPQDTEWAIDAARKLWLLQARPITTLFPLPQSSPRSDDGLRVYFSGSVAQGVYRPLTPMGLQAFRLVSASVSTLFGHPPVDRFAGAAAYREAAGRIFVDVTPVLRRRLGRAVLDRVMRHMEARTAPILRNLASDPRLSPLPTPLWPVTRAVASPLIRGRIPPRVIQAILRPEAARTRAAGAVAKIRAAGKVAPNASIAERLDEAERLLSGAPLRVLPDVSPALAAGLLSSALAGKLLGNLATDDERRVVLRALPHNPTTEMDLELWRLSRRLSADPSLARLVRDTPPEELARDYREAVLPPELQSGLASFFSVYGHRAVAEIDLGLPRWSEDPSHILGVLANYLRVKDPELAPDAQFRRAGREAEGMIADLTRRAAGKSAARGRLVGFLLGRARALLGLREMPKFCFVLLFARVRALIWTVGEELAARGRLEEAGDVFFVSLSEARSADLGGRDLRSLVRERRAAYDHEVRRRRVPRVLLSDGTEPEAMAQEGSDEESGVLRGTAASGGRARGRARVVLEPGGASLEPGEILVAPSTDPGWTPLFLTAGGLVMEMGGPMSHGAIVAREYGIPAVVGVPDATDRLVTGEGILVDGAAGTVVRDP